MRSTARICKFTLGLTVAVGIVNGQATEIVVSPEELSPVAAQLAVRQLRAEKPNESVTVKIEPGTYFLEHPLVFMPSDSGTVESPVVWEGAEGAVFSIGCPVTNWQAESDGSWSAPIPRDANGARIYAEQLWVNGRRAARARLPKTGWLKASGSSSEKVPDADGYIERFIVADAAVRQELAAIPADEWPFAQMVLNRKWACARRVVRGYDAATGALITRTPLEKTPWQEWGTVAVAAVENVRCAFTDPGDWFYDARAGRIRYRPQTGEAIDRTEAVLSVAGRSRVLEFRGACDAGNYVHDLVFRGLQFVHTAIPAAATVPGQPDLDERWVLAGAPKGATQAYQWQAAIASDGAVSGEGVLRVKFDGCRFEHTGNYGIDFSDGCQSNQIVNCRFDDLGAGGIKMGARQGYVPDDKPMFRGVIEGLTPRSTAFNVVSNCSVRMTGSVNLEGVGIILTHCSDSKVLDCNLADLIYTGISVGWVWGYAGSVAQRNEIAYNRIGPIGRRITSDMAGIYTLGTSFGTRIHHNVVHDIESREYGGFGLYCDEGSEGVVMDHNLVWNTTSAGFYMHYGVDNYIRHNIFAWNLEKGSVRMYRPVVEGVRSSLHFLNNIIVTRQAQLCDNGVGTVDGAWANNLWWDERGIGAAKFDGLDWEAWQKSGKESGSRFADPKFVDAAHFDFRLKSDSPARALGFGD